MKNCTNCCQKVHCGLFHIYSTSACKYYKKEIKTLKQWQELSVAILGSVFLLGVAIYFIYEVFTLCR